MICESVVVGPLAVNCYILGCETTREGVVIDAGGDAQRILNAVKQLDLNITYLLNTHGHFDHVGANLELLKQLDVRYLIHANDAPMLSRAADVAMAYGIVGENSPQPTSFLDDGMTITFGPYTIKVLHTPGHTPGGCCLYVESEAKLFTGDTLFFDSIGRTDLPGGSYDQLINSVKTKLFPLPDATTAYPGHGPSTTIGHEKHHNQFF